MAKKKVEIPEVIEIQVGGVKTCKTLEQACHTYLALLKEGVPDKIHFYIQLCNSQTACITFRQEGDKVYVYGDFKGLPDALDYAYYLRKAGKI